MERLRKVVQLSAHSIRLIKILFTMQGRHFSTESFYEGFMAVAAALLEVNHCVSCLDELQACHKGFCNEAIQPHFQEHWLDCQPHFVKRQKLRKMQPVVIFRSLADKVGCNPKATTKEIVNCLRKVEQRYLKILTLLAQCTMWLQKMCFWLNRLEQPIHKLQKLKIISFLG